MRFGLTLSLAEFRPEAGTCVGAPAALLISPHGDGTASSPQRGPEVSERLTQTVTHPRSSTRRREGATGYGWQAVGRAPLLRMIGVSTSLQETQVIWRWWQPRE